MGIRSYVVSISTQNGLTGRLEVDLPPVLDTLNARFLHNFILDRPVLSILYDIFSIRLPLQLSLLLFWVHVLFMATPLL